ncbi:MULTISPECIES: hypothetical protein [Moorena]|uniref:Uncharacterized protein n=1 Tax=Moorena producens 3L TaxID=489825 RepID=F4Y1R5_9CYAN|nr:MULTISPECIES: hypothetical protein [Moorena]EGJ29207.1 hypothetical protein LYNGBM3L_64570 [Moorena producens 3L]NEP32332.1 hypothetical protein [Moorena sp. SIO3B2]OLT64172.1 hypothetical protein BI334_03265 [Moorena producens 3L]
MAVNYLTSGGIEILPKLFLDISQYIVFGEAELVRITVRYAIKKTEKIIMKKVASLFVSLLLVCFTLVGAASPANAYAGFSHSGATGTGPRVDFGVNGDPTRYMIVGAYDNINNIDTKNRPLKIHSTSNNPITIHITELPDASTAPASADLKTLVIDNNTGKLYIGY